MHSKAKLVIVLTIFTACAFGQNNLVKRGPRQTVNIDALPDSAFYAGELHIKFKPGFDVSLATAKKMLGGSIQFGLPAVDAVLKNFGMTSTKRSFEQVTGNSIMHSKHEAWELGRWFTIQLPKKINIRAAIKELRLLSNYIEFAEPSFKRILYEGSDPAVLWTPADSAYNLQWNYNHTAQQGPTSPAGTDADIDLPEAWDIEKGKPAVIVAVLDGGVDTSHPDLRPNLWIGNNGEHFGYNWYAGNAQLEASSHATHVCGTVAAVNNNGIGVSGIAGGDGSANSGVRIMSMEIFNSNGAYAGDEATANAFVYSADHGAAIAQCSWGGGSFSTLLTDAIDYFIMNGGGKVLNGGLVVFSAGNTGNEVESFPGNYPPVLCVTGTNYDDKKSWYSAYGSWVDLCAPGGETTSGGSLVNGGRKGILSTVPLFGSSGYGWLQGTSMACPHVSGVAALCISKAIGFLSNDQLRNMLQTSADDIYPLNPGYEGKLGSGRVNAFKAVKAAALAMVNQVDTVKTFSVVQSCGIATLTWTKNTAQNDVIIAASDTLLFGSPSGILQTGNVLPGGGTIVYKGAASSLTNGLKLNQRRYYQVWSVSGTNYSFHKTSSAIYASAISELSITDATDCQVNLLWTDALNCNNDSVLIVAANSVAMGEPSGIVSLGDVLNGGGKVIYKGRANSYNYTADLDSNIYFAKWNFNATHVYTNPNVGNNPSVQKLNVIKSIAANALNNTSLNIQWAANTGVNCFAADTYLLAYSTDQTFGTPVGTLNAGASIPGGGVVLYVGKNTSYDHTGLNENTPYCYMVWKVKGNGIYSFGKGICVRTPCGNKIITPNFTDLFDGADPSDPDVCFWELTNNTTRTNALKIIGSSNNPDVNPVQGTGMLRFNAYNIPTDQTIRLSSVAIKKGVGKELDVSFRWYQDSSGFTDFSYAGEGVLVQWSTDKANWKNLEFYPRVPNQGLSGWSYKQLTLPVDATAKESVYLSFLFTSKFGNNCYLDSLALKYSSFKLSNGITKIAACESTDSSSLWTNYYDSSGDRLLSIRKNNQDLGMAGQRNFYVSVGGENGAVAISSNANYMSNPGGWLAMKRYYYFKPLIEPTKNINIRFYYFTTDFTAISNAANALLTPLRPNLAQTDLYAWKTNDLNSLYNANPVQGHALIPAGTGYNTNGYTQNVNAPLADSTTWQYNSYSNNLHSMEYLVRHSGGGGLGVGSINGRGALQLLKYTFTGNGNWSNLANWENNNKPPASLPSNGRIIINPNGTSECLLDINLHIPAGAELIVNPGKKFRIISSLQIKR